MKKKVAIAVVCASMFRFGGCVDYSDQATGKGDAAAPSPVLDATTETATPEPDAGSACRSRSYRGGAPGEVACPGTLRCGCEGTDVCCMPAVDALAGACTSLSACRALALECDGPEDCNGGACCLEDRSGGGSSCKPAGACPGQVLCRTDQDCGGDAGLHCVPLDLGATGTDDRGLDSLVGTCGK